MKLSRDFPDRSALEQYLQQQFPAAAARDAALSPIPGGKRQAFALLQQIQPIRYASSRNFLSGNVTRLSPYIRHGVLTLSDVLTHALTLVSYPKQAAKFITELAWRDYWQRLYAQWGSGVWQDREEPKTGFPASAYASEMPADITNASTGLACMDAFTQELHRTGYLHNHARMWMAAYVVHFRRVCWQAGARWFLAHLLDGDAASNNLSWQWVASTFAHKPYFFNKENLERYTDGRHCRECSARCPFDDSYDNLSRQLFRIEVPR
jgi:deoxyribodipyrimidine photo-lyase